MDGIYRIMRLRTGFWAVCKKIGEFENGDAMWRRVSDSYVYRGWARRYALDRCIPIDNA